MDIAIYKQKNIFFVSKSNLHPPQQQYCNNNSNNNKYQ